MWFTGNGGPWVHRVTKRGPIESEPDPCDHRGKKEISHGNPPASADRFEGQALKAASPSLKGNVEDFKLANPSRRFHRHLVPDALSHEGLSNW